MFHVEHLAVVGFILRKIQMLPRDTFVIFWTFVLILALPSGSLKAMDVRGGRLVTIPSGETVPGNLYVGAEEIFMAGTIDGDLVAAGGKIFLDGTVSRDFTAGAGQISVNGR